MALVTAPPFMVNAIKNLHFYGNPSLNAITSICLSFSPLRVRDRGENDLHWLQHRHWRQGKVWRQSGGKQGGLRKTLFFN